MIKDLMYIELKTGYSDDGPAWIGYVKTSKTKKTIYFNDHAFQKYNGGYSNYVDIENGDEYWISGLKKRESNRHWDGHGKIMIDRRAVNEYLTLIGEKELPLNLFEIIDIEEEMATLTYNEINRHMSSIIQTKVVSKKSPWFNKVNLGDIHNVAISHGEGRFVAPEKLIKELIKNGQVATQYVDNKGNISLNMPFNPNGSMLGIEGITSPDGRVLGKMGHSERIGDNLYKNIPGNFNQKIFESGVEYFR